MQGRPTLPPELSRLLDAADSAAQESAWETFVGAHSRLFLHVARSLERDHDAAMDAYAYVLEQLRQDDLRRLRAYAADGRSKFTTWLVVVIRRLCLDHRRQRYGRADPQPENREARAARRRLVDLVGDEIDVDRLAASPQRTPMGELEARELRGALAAALAALEPRDRLLLKLRFEDELPAREIAALMGFPSLFHVYRRLNALLDVLRAGLARRGIEGAQG